MSKVRETADFTMSRRQMLWLASLGSLGLGLGVQAQASEPSQDADFHKQLETLSGNVALLQEEKPDLLGFEQALLITSNAFGGRNAEEADLLAGRLYYNNLETLRAVEAKGLRPLDLSEENVSGVLSKERNYSILSREYFDNLLADTKARVETDSEFRSTIEEYAEIAKRSGGDCKKCDIMGECFPRWVCIVVVSVMAIVIIAGVLIAIL